mgnify:CR=1 FL=1
MMRPRKSIYRSNEGFSLIELMIVILITGVLAAVAVAVYNKNIENAKRAEAVAGIGSIRKSLIISYGIEGHFPIQDGFSKVVGKDWNDIKDGELTGTYFKDKHYKYRSYDGIEYRIKCQKAGLLEKNVWIDETGHWRFNVEDDE